MAPAREICGGETWSELATKRCGHGACVNASAGGEGVAHCVCDAGWALGLALSPEEGAAQCTVSIQNLRVQWLVLMVLTVVVAALTVRSMRFGELDRVRGCASLLGLACIFVMAVAGLDRGGPETSPSAWTTRVALHDTASLFFLSINMLLGLDKYVKAMAASAARFEGKGSDPVGRSALERETVHSIVLLGFFWAVHVTAVLAVNTPNDVALCAGELAYASFYSLTSAWRVHAILHAFDGDLAFVVSQVSSAEMLDKLGKLRRKVALTHHLTVKICLFTSLILGVALIVEVSVAGHLACHARHEIGIGLWFLWLSTPIVGKILLAALKRDRKRASSRKCTATFVDLGEERERKLDKHSK
jgi:hypothetical protein